MRREGAADDFRRGDSVQRLGMVRDGLQGQEFRSHSPGRFRRRWFCEIGGQVFGFEASGVQSQRLQIKRIEIEGREAFQRKGNSEEKEVKCRRCGKQASRLRTTGKSRSQIAVFMWWSKAVAYSSSLSSRTDAEIPSAPL